MAELGNGQEALRTFPGNATVATVRDDSGRPTRITATDGSGTDRVDIGYSYSEGGIDRGNIQSRTSYAEEGVTAGAVTAYGYDSLNRLVDAEETVNGTVSASWSYGYDDAGNRTSQTRSGDTGAAAVSIDYTYNAANQLTGTSVDDPYQDWSYDGAGNQLQNGITGQQTSVDDRGAVTAIGSSSYTAWGTGNTRTLSRTVGTEVTGFMNSPTGLMSGTTWNVNTRAYTRTPDGQLTGLRYYTARYYYAMDALGSVVGIFAGDGSYAGGYSYSPYGEERATGTASVVVQNPNRYIAGYADDSVDLYRLGARYYDPSLGRFTQTDPTGQEKNPYAYAACNPINTKDTTGTSSYCGLLTFYLGVNRVAANVQGSVLTIGGAALTTVAPLPGIGVGSAGYLLDKYYGSVADYFEDYYGCSPSASQEETAYL